MKKIIIGLFLLSVLLISCGNNGAAPPQKTEPDFPYTESDDGVLPYNTVNAGDQFKVYKDYLYFSGGEIYAVPTLGDGRATDYLRMNLKTGNVTSICPDPLCRHDSLECSVYGSSFSFLSPAGELYFLQHYWYIEKNDYHSSVKFVRYNLETNKTAVLEDIGDYSRASFGHELYTEDYRFYHGLFYDARQEDYVSAIMRMNLSNGEAAPFIDSEITEEGNDYTNDFLFTIDDRLYLTDLKTLYSVDFNGGNRIDHIDNYGYGEGKTDGVYVYYTVSGELCRRALDGGEEEKLGITPLNGYVLTENYIYYRSSESITLGKAQIYGYASDAVVLEGGEFWRCKHDGSENELVHTFSGATESYRPQGWIVVGNYIYMYYSWWTDADGDGIFEDGDDHASYPTGGSTLHRILRIDVTTGEEYFIEISK